MTHQLVRHRLASYNQQSQRYTTYNEGDGEEAFDLFVIPPGVAEDQEVLEVFRQAGREAFKAYFRLLEMGVPAEDARYILPFGAESKIVITVNCREFLHILTLRCCNRAQWEIRELAWKMLELAEPTAPYIFMDAGPACRRGPCPEGKMTCGNPYPRAPRRE
jgi:thymidylate synthase (FAD)